MRRISGKLTFASCLAALLVLSGCSLEVLAPAGCTASLASQVMTSLSPVGFWRFQEASGASQALDSSNGPTGTPRPGTYLNSPLLRQTGPSTTSIPYGALFDFSGSGRYVNNVGVVSDYAFVHNNNVFTIMAWVKQVDYQTANGNAVGPVAINAGLGAGGVGFQFRYNPTVTGGHYVLYVIYNFPSVWYASTQAEGIRDNNWHHIVFTSDGTTARSYVDGAFQQSTTSLGTFAGNAQSFLVFGAFGGYYLWATVSDLAIFNKAVTASEIQSIYRAGLDLCPAS